MMPIFDPLEAIARAQQNLRGGGSSDPLNLVPELSSKGAVAVAPKPSLIPGVNLPAPKPSAPTSPVNDALKATPGTLAHNMDYLDGVYGDQPDYNQTRDTIKYRIQNQIKVSPNDIVTKKDARNTAEEILGGIQAGQGPQELHPELYTKSDSTPLDENSTIFDVAKHFSDEDNSPGPKTNWLDRALAYAQAVKTPELAPKGSPLYYPGKVGQGLMDIFNPATYVSSGLGIPKAIGGIVSRQVAGDAGHAGPPVASPGLGQDISDTLGLGDGGNLVRMISGIVGGHLMMHGLGSLGAGDASAPDVVPTATPPTDEGPTLTVKGAMPPPVEDNGGSIQATTATVPKPVKGRPLLNEAIQEATAPPEAPPVIPPTPVEAPPVETPPPVAPVEPIPTVADVPPPVVAAPPPTPFDGGISLGETSAQHPQGGDWYPMENRIVPLDSLTVSHDPNTLVENPNYPQDLQPRDRSGAGLREQVLENAAKLDRNGEITTDYRATDRGAPIVGPDGVVEAGNGRVISMNLANGMDNADWRAYQAKIAAMHPDSVGIKDPVLVRVRTGDMTPDQRVQFATQANGRAVAAATRVEAAKSASSVLDGPTIDGLVDTGQSLGDALKSPQNAPAVQKFINGLDPSDARTVAHDPTLLNDQLRNAAMARILGPDAADVLSRIVQDGDFGRRIVAGIDRAGIPLLKAVRSTETGEVSPDLDFRNLFAEALRVVDDYKGSDNKPGFWDQGRLDQPSPNASRLARALVEAKSQAGVESILEGISNRVSGATDGGLFDDGPPPAKNLDDVLSGLPEPNSAPQMKRVKGARTLKPGFEAGAVDTKTLVGVAAAGAAGIALSQNPAVQDWFRRNGLTGVVEMGALGLGTVGLLYAGATGRLSPGVEPGSFDVKAVLASSRDLAAEAMKSPNSITRLFGEGADAITTAKGEYTLRSAQAAQRIGQAATEAFATKDWLKDPEFLAGNNVVRDIMEQNILDGRDWHEGLTPKWKQFITNAHASMDQALDAAEAEGIRIRVNNDGTQHLKLKPGDSVRVGNGQLGTYTGPEYKGPPSDPSDPFTGAGGFRDPDPHATPRPSAANQRVNPDAEIPHLNVELPAEDGDLLPRQYQIRPGEVFGRPVDRIGEAYVPRIYDRAFTTALANLDKMPQGFKDSLAKMLKAANPDGNLSGDEMMGKLGDIAGSMVPTDSNIASFMSNLERERQWALAKFDYVDADGNPQTVDPYMSSYIDSVTSYLDRAWKRVGIASQFGPDPQSLGGVIKIIKDKNPAYGDYLDKLTGRILGIGPDRYQGGLTQTASRLEGSYQAVTKLTPTTALRPSDDILRALTATGGKQVLKAAYDLLMSPDKAELRNTADAMSAAREQWMTDLNFGKDNPGINPGIGGKIRKGVTQLAKGDAEGLTSLADAVMTATGIRSTHIVAKRLAAIAGLRDATSALDAAATASGTIPAEVSRKLDFYGLGDSVDAARTNGAESAIMNDPKVLAKVAANIRQNLLYTGAAEDMPLWASSPGGSILARFKKPSFTATRFLLHGVIGEAAKGNVKPLARFVANGVVLGSGVKYATNLMNGQGVDGETRWLWNAGDHAGAIERFFTLPGAKTLPGQVIQAFTDPKSGPTAMGLLTTAAHNIHDVGGLGLPGDVTPEFNSRIGDITGNPAPNPWDAAMPVSYSEAQDAIRRIAGAQKAADTYGQKLSVPVPNPTLESAEADYRWQKMGGALFEQLRGSISMARKITDMLDVKPDLVRLHDMERQDKASGGKLPVASYVEMAKLKSRVEGRFADLAQAIGKAKGHHASTKTQVFNAAGIEASGVAKKRKGL